MKSRPKTVFIILILLFVLAAAGVVWLGNAHVSPPVQTVNQVLPDDRIPH